MTDWAIAQQNAARTARLAVTMTKVRIRRCIAKTKWQLVTFVGPAGGESIGIVDMMAVRKNHAPCELPGKRGDLFEIVLIQVKGGSAPFPSPDEIMRLKRVGRTYRAKAIPLGQWKRGSQVRFFRLRNAKRDARRQEYWAELASLDNIFK